MKGPSFIDIPKSFALVIISSWTWLTYLLVSLELKYLPVRIDRESFIQTLVTQSKGVHISVTRELVRKAESQGPRLPDLLIGIPPLNKMQWWFLFTSVSDKFCGEPALELTAAGVW